MIQGPLEPSGCKQPTAPRWPWLEGESPKLEATLSEDFVLRIFLLWDPEREKSLEMAMGKQLFAASKIRLRLVGSPTFCDCEIWQGHQMLLKDAKSEVARVFS